MPFEVAAELSWARVLNRSRDFCNRSAPAVLDLVESDDPPLQLLLGSDALKSMADRIARRQREIEALKRITVSTDG
ncbi:hypothetical protein PMI07_005365 [Rhizobium sp. CF080]|nr:hypothetical protein PMI07_005365 [Rhizobium sp. CF080]